MERIGKIYLKYQGLHKSVKLYLSRKTFHKHITHISNIVFQCMNFTKIALQVIYFYISWHFTFNLFEIMQFLKFPDVFTFFYKEKCVCAYFYVKKKKSQRNQLKFVSIIKTLINH